MMHVKVQLERRDGGSVSEPGEDRDVREEVIIGYAAFSVSAEPSNARQASGQLVADPIVSMDGENTTGLERLVAPWIVGKSKKRNARPEARDHRPLIIPKAPVGRGDVLEKSTAQRSLELSEPAISTSRRFSSDRHEALSWALRQLLCVLDELVPRS